MSTSPELLTDAVAVSEPEDALDLVEGDMLLHFDHIPIESWAHSEKDEKSHLPAVGAHQ